MRPGDFIDIFVLYVFCTGFVVSLALVRYYEEQEYATRVAKRRTRLITAAEESFTHIKRLREDAGKTLPSIPP